MKAIELNGLTKRFRERTAVDGLSFSIEQGELFSLLGQNGAGKTTTIRMLSGLLRPTEGDALLMGKSILTDPEAVRCIINVSPQETAVAPKLTVRENLELIARLYGKSAAEAKKSAEAMLSRFSLADRAREKAKALSGGLQRRLSIAMALISEPQVLFLDEPTSGLDPESAQNVNQMIQNLARKEGVTIFLCTHQLRYAQEICTRYGLIEQGSLLASGTMEELRAQVFTTKTLCVCASAVPDGLNFIKRGANEFEVNIRDKKEIPGLVRKIVEAGEDIYSVNLMEPSLEDIYFALTTGRKEDRGI